MKKKRYEVLERIGAGGMGEVFKAFDRVNGFDVAIKILPAKYSSNEEIKERFLREMTICSKLEHPNIIKVYDYGQLKDTLYYVMEYVEGPSLADMSDDEGALPVPFSILVMGQILEALGHIHDSDLIHRDVKPANVLVSRKAGRRDRAVLMDFGLVKAFDSQLTRTGRILGTPRYIAPEMLSTGEVDHRSDIFQVGVVLYEMVTGVYAFKGKTRAEVARNCLTRDPEPASLLNPEVDVNLDNVIYNAIEKDPDKRYSSCEEMLVDLRALKKGKRIYRRNVRRSRQHSMVSPVLETIDADDPSLAALLEAESPERKVPYRWLWALLPLLVVPFVAYVLWGMERVYTVRDIRFDVGIDKAVISWRSETAYPTRVRYRLSRGGAQGRGSGGRGADAGGITAVGASNKPERRHKIVLGNLLENKPYLVRILFPGGKSSGAYRFHTKDFALVDLHAVYAATGKVDISWKTDVPARGYVEYVLPGETRKVSEEGFQRIHRLIVDVPDVTEDFVYKVTVRDRSGHKTFVKGDTLPSVVKLASRLEKKMAAFDAAAWISDCSKLVDKNRAIADDPARLSPLLQERLEKLPFRDSLRMVAPVARLFFESGSVSLAKKTEFFHCLGKLADLRAFLASVQLDDLSPLPPLGNGPWAYCEGFLGKSPRVSTYPVGVPPDCRMKACDGENEKKLSLLLMDGAGFDRTELSLDVAGLTARQKLVVTINGRLSLRFYGAVGDAGRRVFSRPFAPELLKDSNNDITLRLSTLSGESSDVVVRVFTLLLVARR